MVKIQESPPGSQVRTPSHHDNSVDNIIFQSFVLSVLLPVNNDESIGLDGQITVVLLYCLSRNRNLELRHNIQEKRDRFLANQKCINALMRSSNFKNKTELSTDYFLLFP